MSNRIAQKLAFLAAIFFVFDLLGNLAFGVMAYTFLPEMVALFSGAADPAALAFFESVQLFIPMMFAIFVVLDIVYVILALRWRHEPEKHTAGLIIIGILNVLLAVKISGVLALFAGILAEGQ